MPHFFFFFFLIQILTLFLISQPITSQLTSTYYQHSCPNFEQIVQQTTTNKQISSPTTAAATLRLFFHDCFVSGCDASTLITSTHTNKAERDADINLSLPGDAFDLIVRAKTALELTCPMTVSCADIISLATRNLVVMMGGPYYNVKFGRKDSFISRAEDVEKNLPRPSTPIDQHLKLFGSKGFSAQEMVALTGAHTIGFSHCKEFSAILFNYSRSQQSDPSYYSEFARRLRSACKDYKSNPTLSVFNDVVTPNKFDNVYYSNIRKGLGLLASDHALSSDARTRNWVKLYSGNQDAFFKAFARAMEKLSEFGVKVGRDGEVRRRCDAFNF